MHVLVVDDEPESRENLKTILEDYCPEVSAVHLAASAQEGWKGVQEHKPDVLFLDIMMPGMSGLELAESLQHTALPVVFVTGHDRYAIRAIKASALDYLLKPVSLPELQKTVRKLHLRQADPVVDRDMSLLTHNLRAKGGPYRLKLPWKGGFKVVEVADIVRFKSDNTYTEVYLKADRLLVSMSIGELEDLLSTNGFIRVHNSHLVNLACIDSYSSDEGGTLWLKDGSKIPVSRRRLPAFREAMEAYLISVR